MTKQQAAFVPTDKDRQPDLLGEQYLGIKATHFDRELVGIALALEEHNDTNMVVLLSDCKPAIWVVEKIDSETVVYTTCP